MKLFIGNPTRQDHVFAYRSLGQSGQARMPTIRKGGQIPVPGDLTKDQIDFIVAQHLPYGMRPIDEALAAEHFKVGLVYSVDRPISAEMLKAILDHNTVVLDEKGKEFRQEAAIALNNKIEESLIEQQFPAGLNEVEVTVAEERNATDDTAGQLAESSIVTRIQERQPDETRKRGIGAGRRNSRVA